MPSQASGLAGDWLGHGGMLDSASEVARAPTDKMKLYNLESCPFCIMVRRKLDDLGLKYEKIDVPASRQLRTEVIKVSGQPLVPVLVDGDVVLDDEDKIIEYLDSKYGENKRGGQ